VTASDRFFIERVERITPHYGRLARLQAEGWTVAAVLDRSRRPHTIVLLGCVGAAAVCREPRSHAYSLL
jgi:hypothetical protein